MTRFWTYCAPFALLTLASLLWVGCSDGGNGSVSDTGDTQETEDGAVLDVPFDGPMPPDSVILEIESTIEWEDVDGNTTISIVTADVNLERGVVAGSQANYQGFDAMMWVEFDFELDGCEGGTQQLLDGLVEAQLTVDVATDELELFLNPGDPLVSQQLTCDGITDEVPFGHWRSGYDLLHASELSSSSAGAGYPYKIGIWDTADGVLGQRVYMQSETAEMIEWTENTTITLR